MRNITLLAVVLLAALTAALHAQSGVRSPNIDKTVFIGGSTLEADTGPSLSGTPPSIDFEGAIWAHVHRDTTAPLLQDIYTNVNSEITGYELWREDNLIHGDMLVEVFNLTVNFGTYVSCTDLNTGALLWRQSYNVTNSDLIDIDLNVYTLPDGRLELSGMRLLATFVPNIFPFGYAVRKVLDANTGQLIERVYTPFSDGGLLCHNSNGQMGRTLPIEPENRYLTACTYPTGDGENIMILLDGDGAGRPTDTFGLVAMPPSLYDLGNPALHLIVDMAELPGGGFVIGSTTTKDASVTSGTVSELLFVNTQGALVERLDISPYLGLHGFFQMELAGEHIIITAFSLEPVTPSSFASRTNLLILDQAGGVVSYLPNLSMLGGLPVRDIRSTPLPEGGHLLVTSSENHCLNYFMLDDTGEISFLHSSCQSDPNWLITPRYLRIAPDGAVITGATWYSGGSLGGEQFQATFSLDPAVLGLVPLSAGSAQDAPATLKVHPNPSSGLLTVGLPTGATGLLFIHDLAGREVMSHRVLDATAGAVLDVKGLADGAYFVRFASQGGLYTARFIKGR